VPFIVVAPGLMPARTRSLAELIDLYPTLCELSGLPQPGHVEGQSLLRVLQDPATSGMGVALSQHTRFKERYMGRAMRTDRHRYVAWFETGSGRVVERELYDHERDPLETRNLAGEAEQSNLIQELHARLLREFRLEE